MKFAVLSLLGLVAVQAIQMEESFYDDDFLVEEDEELFLRSVDSIQSEIDQKTRMLQIYKTSLLKDVENIKNYLDGRKVFYSDVINALDHFNKFRGVFETFTPYMEGL